MMASYKDLFVYQKGFELSMDIFNISKRFPKEETYSLTDQIRRCSRSVCTNFAEAYRRRKYPAHFISKLSDSDAENTETEVWLDFSAACRYINSEEFRILNNKSAEVGRLLGYMMKNPSKFLLR
jgi:four helix bundle protein